MQRRRTAAALILVFAGLVVAQGGCAPGPDSPDSPATASTATSAAAPNLAPDTAGSSASDLDGHPPADTAASPPQAAADEAAPDRARSPAQPISASPRPALGINPAPAVSPSASPVPARAAGASHPTSATIPELVAVSLAKDNRVALIDPMTGKVARMVDLSRPAATMAMAPDGRLAWAFAPQPGKASVGLFDVLTGDRHEDIQFHNGDSPIAVTFSSDGTRAYIAMGSDLSSPPAASTIAFAASGGREFGRVTVGRQTNGVHMRRQLSSVAISPGPTGDVLYAAGSGSGVVWALDPGSGAVLNEIEVGGGPTSIVADPVRQRVYVLVDTLNQVVAIDTTTLGVTNRVDLPARPVGAAVGADGTVFVTGGDGNGQVWVVEPGATEIRSVVPIGGWPVGLAVSSDGRSLYVPDSATSTLAIVSADTVQVTRTIPLASAPVGVVAVHASTAAQQLTTTPTTAAPAAPTPTPTLVPTPTPLPEGARPPDHLPAGAVAEPFLSGAEAPVALAFAPDGRLFYNEVRTGNIRVVQNGALLPDPFYQFLVANQPETGLLGLTLDPDFAHNHYLYAFYTSVAADGQAGAARSGPNAVVRLTDVDNKGTEVTPVLRNLPSIGIHASGTLRFGPDGKLYVSLGDNDRGTNAQDLGSLAGKILRVNPDGSMPQDNPFAGDSDKQGTIWAYGLHNAASFAFHPVGHQLLAVDDGAGGTDALDVIVRGANYGSPRGGYQFKPGVNDPIAVINPPIGSTGSTFYTGTQLPDWTNDWFYCNQGQGQLRRVRLAPGSFDRVVFEEVVKQGCVYDVTTGPDGALYYSDAQGIYRIRQPGADVLPAVKMASVPTSSVTPTPR